MEEKGIKPWGTSWTSLLFISFLQWEADHGEATKSQLGIRDRSHHQGYRERHGSMAAQQPSLLRGSSHPWCCHNLWYPPETAQNYILAYSQHQLSGTAPGQCPGSGHWTSTQYLPFAQQTHPTGSVGSKWHLLPISCCGRSMAQGNPSSWFHPRRWSQTPC